MANQWSSIQRIGAMLILLVVCLSAGSRQKLQLVAKWKEMEYQFPSSYIKEAALEDGSFIRGNSFPAEVDVYYEDHYNSKVFVTVPRFKTGVPVCLGYITTKQGKGGPKLQPYPDYSWYSSNGTDCNGITSVLRVAIDKCNRIWVLDTGRIDYYQACPPQVLVFDLKTDILIHRYKFPESQYTAGRSMFETILVDVRDSPKGNCENTMAYIGDIGAYGLVVYDFCRDKSWRIENKLMGPVPKFETFTISGETFELQDGILGMALSSNCKKPDDRVLYFHALASDTENSVPLKLIDDKKLWLSKSKKYRYAFKTIGSRGVQSVAETIDQNGNIFFGLTNPNAIVCWDSSTPYIKSNLKIVAESERKFQFPCGVKIVKNPDGKEELWVLTNRYQKFALGTMKTDEVNFRIFSILVEKLLDGTKCKGVPMG